MVAAMARTKPPKKSIIMGSAKVAIISVELNNLPNSPFSPLKKGRLLSDTVKSITVIMHSEVAHGGIASVSHIKVANTKIAIMRC